MSAGTRPWAAERREDDEPASLAGNGGADAAPPVPGAGPGAGPDDGRVRPSGSRPARLVRALISRFEHLIREMGKFGVVGGISFVGDTAVLKACLSTGMNPLLAKTLSTTVGASMAFIGNRYWTWRDREHTALHREYGLYFAFNAVGLAIGLACLGISHFGLGHVWPQFRTDLADIVSANIVGLFFGMLFRFWSYRRFVFPTPMVVDPAPVVVSPPEEK